MSIKSQLHACVDALMTATRAAQRASDPDRKVLETLRACQDVVERLEQSAAEVTAAHLEMALSVVTHGLVELGRAEAPAPTVLAAVRNAVDRLERLRAEVPD